MAVTAAALPGAAQAGDQSFTPYNDISECQLSTPEICDLHIADLAATEYAKTKAGIGILIHVGEDVRNHPEWTPDLLGQHFVNRIRELGEEAQYFVSQNDAPATGINYYVGDLLVGAHNGTEVRGLQTAWDTAPEAVAWLKQIRSVAAAPAPDLEG